MGDLTKEFVFARKRAVPLLAVRTADQPAACTAIFAAATAGLDEGDPPPPVIRCDPINGMVGLNLAGKESIAAMGLDPSMATRPETALGMLAAATPGTIAIVIAGDRWAEAPVGAAGMLLLRDPWAADGSTLVLLSSQWAPARELGADVHVIDDPRPGDEDRTLATRRLLEERGMACDEGTASLGARFTRGLSRFAVDQTIMLAINGSGLRQDRIANRWCEAIDAVPGLSVVSVGSDDTAERLIGMAEWQEYASRVANGRVRPDLILWLDEIEKSFAGTDGGSNDGGVSANLLRASLTGMDRLDARGAILLGGPGSGKSLAARSFGLAAGVPVVRLDLDATKEGLVGASEARLRAVFEALAAMARHGRTYWIATANTLAGLRPELKRRFKGGIWYNPLPNRAERVPIWQYHIARRGLPDPVPPEGSDVLYTGSDIANVCGAAWEMGISLAQVMVGYVASTLECLDEIEALERRAANRMRCATYPGPYRMADREGSKPATGSPRRAGKGV